MLLLPLISIYLFIYSQMINYILNIYKLDRWIL